MARKAQFDGLRTARSTAVISARALSDEFAYAISHRGDDCDETRPDVNPHATEICDRLDNDCDGEVDEGQTFFAYSDADGDGWGDPESALEVCPDDIRQAQEEGEWLILRGGDCDDTDPERWADCG
ncbi:MAG: hypothetical protein GY937_16590 [bacterium]|nr:hypothetical protein [bacterium]